MRSSLPALLFARLIIGAETGDIGLCVETCARL
jgi:hypothetical protein